jgi:hypothetical protein
MAKQVFSPSLAANALCISRSFAAALLGLGMVSIAFGPVLSALAAPPTKTPVQEESVLVATREAPAAATKTGGTAPADALEPTPQSSDNAPEVASVSDNNPDAGAHFGDSLVKIADPPKHKKDAKPPAELKKPAAKLAKAAASAEVPAMSGGCSPFDWCPDRLGNV